MSVTFTGDEVATAFRAYLTAALWTGLYEPAESWEEAQPEPLDAYAPDLDDVPTEIADELRGEWEDFLAGNVSDVEEFMGHGFDLSQVAHDFHLTRNGHGAGFWDRGAGDVGERLTEAAKVYGTAELMGHPDGDGGVSIYVSN